MTDLFDDPEHTTLAPSRRARRQRRQDERREKERQGKRAAQRIRNLVTFMVMAAALVGIGGAGWYFLSPIFAGLTNDDAAEVTDYPGPGSGAVEVVVNAGDSGSAIGATLVEADVVASVTAFVAAFNANPAAAGIQPGTYSLPQQIPAVEAVAALLNPSSRADVAITIPEGWRASQVYARMAELMELDLSEVQAGAESVTLPEQAAGSIEGWLFPSTYIAGPDSTATTVLQEMVDTTVSVLRKNEIPEESWNAMIIKASIIELEVANAADRAKVARVIDNRLAGCTFDGFLGMDSTLVYELDKPVAEITVTEWATPTPYNGRMMAGLPPTAISSPSENSIQAAASPAQGDWCYFVTVNLDTKETKFTASQEEFDVFSAELQQWLAEQEKADS